MDINLLDLPELKEFIKETVNTYKYFPYVLYGADGTKEVPKLTSAVLDEGSVMNLHDAFVLTAAAMGPLPVVRLAHALVQANESARIQLGEYFNGVLDPEARYSTIAPQRVLRFVEMCGGSDFEPLWTGGTLYSLSAWIIGHFLVNPIKAKLESPLSTRNELNGYGLHHYRTRELQTARSAKRS
jgi:hypothetical protein